MLNNPTNYSQTIEADVAATNTFKGIFSLMGDFLTFLLGLFFSIFCCLKNQNNINCISFLFYASHTLNTIFVVTLHLISPLPSVLQPFSQRFVFGPKTSRSSTIAAEIDGGRMDYERMGLVLIAIVIN